MAAFVFRRLGQAAAVMLVVAFIAFTLFQQLHQPVFRSNFSVGAGLAQGSGTFQRAGAVGVKTA